LPLRFLFLAAEFSVALKALRRMSPNHT
jgi:hypothetical protein